MEMLRIAPIFVQLWQAIADPKYYSHVHFSTFES